MTRAYAMLTALILSLICGVCHAGWTVDFVRITCIPEARFLRVEYAPVDGSVVEMGVEPGNKQWKQRLAVWKKHGYFDPLKKIRYKCRMPDSTYRIYAVQPPPKTRGECGVSQSITLSLLRNGKPVLNRIIFGSNCWRGATVDEFEITDGVEGKESAIIHLLISSQSGSKKVFESLRDAYGIDQERVEEYLEKDP